MPCIRESLLNPYDSELIMMVRSLTGKEPIVKEDIDYFEVYANYVDHKDVDYINAIICAVKGRMGNRFVEVNDYPDECLLQFRISYSDEELPKVSGSFRGGEGSNSAGRRYKYKDVEISAVQVRRDNMCELSSFCGNGQLMIERCPNGKATFTFEHMGIFRTVPEGHYIARDDKGIMSDWSKEKFEELCEQL